MFWEELAAQIGDMFKWIGNVLRDMFKFLG